jgi:hypothetical protein
VNSFLLGPGSYNLLVSQHHVLVIPGRVDIQPRRDFATNVVAAFLAGAEFDFFGDGGEGWFEDVFVAGLLVLGDGLVWVGVVDFLDVSALVGCGLVVRVVVPLVWLFIFFGYDRH